jgi:hypothetical protein
LSDRFDYFESELLKLMLRVPRAGSGRATSREDSLVLTKLEEALLWHRRSRERQDQERPLETMTAADSMQPENVPVRDFTPAASAGGEAA